MGIATGFGLDGPGIESRWGQDFAYLPRPALRPTQSPVRTMGTGFFPGVKRPERGFDHTTHLALRLSKTYSYTSTPPMSRTVCTELQCLYTTAIPLFPSVPVQYSYTTTPLSACTVQLYLYSPQYLYSTAIPLLPSVPLMYSYTSPSLSACTE